MLKSMGLVMLFLISGQLTAQSIRGELIGGFNLAQVDGDEVVGYRKPGFNAGVGAALPLGGNWFLSIETLFNQKGAYRKYPNEYNDSLDLPYYNLRLSYADIPLLIHYNDKNKVTFGAGFSFGRLVQMKEIEHGRTIDWNTTNGPYDSGDWNILIDLRFRMWWKLYFNFRYAYSIDKIRTRTFHAGVETWTRNQFNNLLTFRVVMVFNEKID